MPDTGLPWEIPYIEPSDLVRDYPAADEAQALAIAAGLSAAGNAGIGSNVVQTVKTDVFSASVAAGAISADVTGLTVTITPTSITSKVLVRAVVNGGSDNPMFVTLYRDGAVTNLRGDAAGSRQRVSSITIGGNAANLDIGGMSGVEFLDSPSTTSAVTYSLRLGHGSTGTVTVYVNRGRGFPDSTNVAQFASSITAIEVSA